VRSSEQQIEKSAPEIVPITRLLDLEQKRAAYIFVGFLAVYAIARGIRAAAAAPFWFDEFFTLTIANLPTWHDVWGALARGFEAQTPLFYFLERVALAAPVKKEVALRLPSILAFPCILVCVFSYVKRHYGEAIACLGSLALLTTSLFHKHMIDARPYTLTVAVIAFSFLCYQRLSGSRLWTALFFVGVILAESLHYYALFSIVPIWLAEFLLLVRTRRLRWTVWLALLCGFLPLILALPLLLKVKVLYGPHFFARPAFSQASGYYGVFFETDRTAGLALLLVSFSAICWSLLHNARDSFKNGAERDCEITQDFGVLALCLLPFVAFVIARITNGALLDRYVLATTIGILVGLSCALSIVRSKPAVVFLAIFLLPMVGLTEEHFWRLRGHDARTEDGFSVRSTRQLFQVQNLVRSSGNPNLPVVVDQGPLYMQIVHYSPPDWTTHLVYLTDEEAEFTYHGTDTTVRVFKMFQSYFPLRLADYTQFTTHNPEFLVYSEPEGWMLAAMRREGASIQVLKAEGVRTVYLVKMKGTSAP
jgi:hypothetical protein